MADSDPRRRPGVSGSALPLRGVTLVWLTTLRATASVPRLTGRGGASSCIVCASRNVLTEALLYLLFGWSPTCGNALDRCFCKAWLLSGFAKPCAAIGTYVAVLGRSSRRLLMERGDRMRAVPALLGRDDGVIVLCRSFALLKSSVTVDADTLNGSVSRNLGDRGDAILFVLSLDDRHARQGKLLHSRGHSRCTF